MASSPPEFTEEDQQALDALIAKRDAAQRAETEAREEEERTGFQSVMPLFDVLDMKKIRPILKAASEDENLSEENKARIARIAQILQFDYTRGLVAERDRLFPPAPVVTEPAPPPA